MRRSILGSAAILLLAALGGCVDPNKTGPCPEIGILKDAQTLTKFRPGGGRDATDVEYEVRIAAVNLTCTYVNKDTVRASIVIDIEGERGPASTTASAPMPYFVAVSRGGEDILAREGFPAGVDLGSAGPKTMRERVRNIRIPLARGYTGAAYQVIVGFELTPEQVAYNRTRAARP